MTYAEAVSVLNRVRAGDKTPTQREINDALILTGDISGWVRRRKRVYERPAVVQEAA